MAQARQLKKPEDGPVVPCGVRQAVMGEVSPKNQAQAILKQV